MTAVQLPRVRAITPAEVHALSVRALGLDPDALDLTSPEALAALVRRAASVVAPCSPRTLRETVLRALSGLAGSTRDEWNELRASVDETIEAVTIYGDLLELPAEDPNDSASARTLYLAPPTYVRLGEVLFLLGGALDGVDAIPSDLRPMVEYRSHTRRLSPDDPSEVAKRLHAIGWVELPRRHWLPPSTSETAEQILSRATATLSARPTAGDVPGLSVLDTERPTTYYPGRWTEPAGKSGRFVARREQRYGADLWSYVDLSGGAVTHLVDLPISARADVRSCDAAWHLQMAIDQQAGRPQRFHRRPVAPAGSVIIDLFSPVPLWARRLWDVLGEEVPRSRSLFAYRFPAEVFADVERTLRDDLWLAERPSAS